MNSRCMGRLTRRSRRPRPWGRQFTLAPLVGLILVSVLTTSCGTGTTGPGPHTSIPLQVTSVHVLRTSAFPENHIPPLDQTVTDATQTQHLYDALYALPPFPNREMACPADWGEAYHLTFYSHQERVAWAIVKPDGCQGVMLSHGDERWSATAPQFWQVFADALGVPETVLFPRPQPAGPSAPTAVPGQPEA